MAYLHSNTYLCRTRNWSQCIHILLSKFDLGLTWDNQGAFCIINIQLSTFILHLNSRKIVSGLNLLTTLTKTLIFEHAHYLKKCFRIEK
jgi:hypothetical protein